ncbi:MAG: acetoacetate--CoA ligase [Alphaproteobacteria bacterium]|nr:acetoacetate--CoA ligase [Alphaproteobacteria bacterium]
MSLMMASRLWTPPSDAATTSSLGEFAAYLKAQGAHDWGGDYESLWAYSTNESAEFWSHLWDWHGVIGEKGGIALMKADQMIGGQFFPNGTLNYAENMLVDADHRPAIIAHREEGADHPRGRVELSRLELKNQVMAVAGWLKSQGVEPGDRVAAYTPNIPEAVVVMLAAATIGAVFSSCSSDFGLGGVKDRFGQIDPVVLMVADGYRYNGKPLDRMGIVRDLVAAVPSIRSVLVVPFLDDAPDTEGLPATLYQDALRLAEPVEDFAPMPFNHPLYIMYSSGTTGAPKCITHGAGGTLLQHIKEHRLQGNTKAGDAVFYFTTCGWMMWNWLVSAIAVEAPIVLYEGNPFFPGPERLWEMAAAEKLVMFGTSAKYIDAVRKSGYRPGDAVDLAHLKQICSTGSPLSTDGFAFIYDAIKTDLQLASISGGTDIVSCFVLGCPVKPVYGGEIQARGLGMAVDVWDDDGQPIRGEQGELVCTKPFPSMPIGFWGDDDGRKYRAAYFEHFPGIWRHGDWATLTEHDGIIIHGRSDATLNPGGVRIGTAEIYRQVEAFDEVAEALVIGQTITEDGASDVRVILFVRMAEGQALTDALKTAIAQAIRKGATPRHVPQVILDVADIPRTRSGKITELAVRDVVDGRQVKNTEALANPEALDYFRNRPELS